MLFGIIYYYGSIFFSKNGQFVHYNFSYSNDIEESWEKGLFLTDTPIVIISKDSANLIKNGFDFWIDKSETTKSYGLLPFGFTTVNDRVKSLNINFKDKSNKSSDKTIFIKIGDELMDWTIIGSQSVPIGDTVRIDFFMGPNGHSFGSAKIIEE